MGIIVAAGANVLDEPADFFVTHFIGVLLYFSKVPRLFGKREALGREVLGAEGAICVEVPDVDVLEAPQLPVQSGAVCVNPLEEAIGRIEAVEGDAV